jgi:putative flippase GtrA
LEQPLSNQVFNKKDLFAYFIVAGIGAIIQFPVSSILQDWFDISFTVSVRFAYWTSLIVGFFLTKLFAFDVRNTEQTKREMLKFILVGLFAGEVMTFTANILLQVINSLNSASLINIPFSKKLFNINQFMSHSGSMVSSFITNYYLHRVFTFKSTGFYNRLKSLIK